jgi:hypothetical protein
MTIGAIAATFRLGRIMAIKNRMYNFVDSCMHRLPCTIYVKPIIRKVLVILFFWGALLNAVVFMLLYITLYYGYDIFGLKEFIKHT